MTQSMKKERKSTQIPLGLLPVQNGKISHINSGFVKAKIVSLFNIRIFCENLN